MNLQTGDSQGKGLKANGVEDLSDQDLEPWMASICGMGGPGSS